MKIGIIDSGINKIYSINNSAVSGVFLKKHLPSNKIISSNSIDDNIGHGSECYKIISSIVNDVEYFIVKVFDQEMISDIDLLAAGIQTCLDEGTDIINISAGVRLNTMPESLRICCDEAYSRNIALVAAGHILQERCFPAYYKNVIGVGSTELKKGELYQYNRTHDIEFYTSASDLYPAHVTWSASTSFSCAKMTAYATQIIKLKGRMTLEGLKSELINHLH